MNSFGRICMKSWLYLRQFFCIEYWKKNLLHLNLSSKNKTNFYSENFFTIEIKPKNKFTFLAAAAAANLATPEPFFFWGLNLGGLGEGTRFLEALVEAAEVVFLVLTSVSLSLLSLKMLLYFSTVLRFLLLFELAVPTIFK